MKKVFIVFLMGLWIFFSPWALHTTKKNPLPLFLSGEKQNQTIDAATAEQKKLFPYEGKVEHIFFHPLIAYPQTAQALKSKKQKKYLEQWFISTAEFRALLENLYARNYVLVSAYDTFAPANEKEMQVKSPLVPKGKKPLVISVDDVNYYPSMKTGGTVHKLFVDKNNRLASQTTLPNGKIEVSHDNEIMLILENFIEQHPDFSINGARGIIAVTGYKGVFGYNTQNPKAENYEQNLAAAKAVADKLKKMGWLFASHSWAHKYALGQNDDEYLQEEKKWQQMMFPIVGKTELFIFPIGVLVFSQVAKVEALKSLGYKVCYGVHTNLDGVMRDGLLLFNRQPIDGRSIDANAGFLKKFMNAKLFLSERKKKNSL